MTFSGRWFDGTSARPVSVELAAGPEGLSIVPAGGGAARLWRWADLKASALFRSGDQLGVRRGNESVQARAEFFEGEIRRNWPRADLFRSPFHAWTATGGRFAFTLAAAAGLLAAVFLVGVPAAGDLAASALPDSWARQAGASLRDQVVGRQKTDLAGAALLQKFWDDLALPAGPTVVTWVEDPSTANAFALLGGQVLVYRGLLEECRSADELAGVLAHETAHGELKHSARMIGRSLAGAFLLGYLLGDPSGLTGAVLGNVDSLRQLQFSREMESEADAWAARALGGKADIRALGGLLDRIDRAAPPEWAGFLSSHPATGDRQAGWNRAGASAPAGPRLQADFEAVRAHLSQD